MISEIQKICDDILEELKEYLQVNCEYKPYVYTREPNTKKFPIVVFKELYHSSRYTTLKYTDDIYYFGIGIYVYSVQINGISSKTIVDEITNLIEIFFKNTYKIRVRISKDTTNSDTSVCKNLIQVSFKVDTKYKNKLIIKP